MSIINEIINNPTLVSIIHIILILIGGYIVFKILEKIIYHFWDKYNLDFAGYYLLNDILKYIIGLVATAWILNEIGIDLHGIFISVGVISIIVGFAAKDTFSNFMSGLFLLSDKTIKAGEVIKIKDIKGKITKVNLRTTTLKTVDNFKVTIPNSILSNTPYTVYNNLELNKGEIKICLPYKISIIEFEKKLQEKLNNYTWILKEKNARIEDIKGIPFGNELKFYFWVEDYSKLSKYKVIVGEDANKILLELLEK